jgi:hypothetical protein
MCCGVPWSLPLLVSVIVFKHFLAGVSASGLVADEKSNRGKSESDNQSGPEIHCRSPLIKRAQQCDRTRIELSCHRHQLAPDILLLTSHSQFTQPVGVTSERSSKRPRALDEAGDRLYRPVVQIIHCRSPENFRAGA